MWLESRALLRPQFLKQRLSDLDIFEEHMNKLISLLPTDGRTIDIMNLWYRFTLDASSDYLFGRNVNSLDSPKVVPLEYALTVGGICRGLRHSSRGSNAPLSNRASVEVLLSEKIHRVDQSVE